MSTNAPSIGINLRVTGHCNQGGRKYMEDAFAVAYQQTNDENDLEYAYFGVFDGHGGRDAAIFAREHLMNAIVSQKCFWSDNDENVLKAIKEGFVATHMAMWKEVGKWPQTISGLPSTSGTTASVVFIRRGKLYVGHVGDSAVVLGFKDPESKHYCARSLTSDHKPELPAERKRIEDGGGSVMSKCGVQRVVWNRPRIGHKGPIRRSTHIDQIPFLAVARSLGDLWSYDYLHSQFNVSPEPDVCVVPIDVKADRCVIVATDGVWNMISSRDAVRFVEAAEKENERFFLNNDSIPIGSQPLINPSRLLVDKAISLWYLRNKRADNATVLTIMIDPPGPPRREVLLRKRMLLKLRPRDEVDHSYSTREPLINGGQHESVNSALPPEINLLTSNQQDYCSTPADDSYFKKLKSETPHAISSDYDIWMKGSLCLQRSDGCRFVPDIGDAVEQDQDDMWRLAPTPPMAGDSEAHGRNVTYKPRYPLVRTNSVCIQQQIQNAENSLKSDKIPASYCCHQMPSSSAHSSYSNVTDPVAEVRRTTSYLGDMGSISGAQIVKNNLPSPAGTTAPLQSLNKTSGVSKRLNRVKRKSMPGKRELFFLLAKESRLGRNHMSPFTRTKHITRSRVRLRKPYY